MNIYTLRRVLVLLILGGLIYGGWWAYTRRGGIKSLYETVQRKIFPSSASTTPSPSPPNAPASSANNGASGGVAPGGSPPPANPDGAVVLDLLTSPTKKDWLQGEIERFNKENDGAYRVEPRFVETREAMQAILFDKEKPVLWSPSSPVWTARLAEAYEQRKGERIIDLNDTERARVYLRSPLVFLTTKQKATFLRPLLSGPDAWKNIAELGAGTRKTPWGRLHFSHADPIASNSGFLTLALMLNDYAHRNNLDASDEKVAGSPGFASFLKATEAGLVFDIPAKEGSSPLLKAFTQDTTLYDFIVTYESSALAAVAENDKLAVIYPEPTVISEQSAVVVNGAWVTSEQREGAAKFLAFLASRESLQNGIAAHFRTTQSSGPMSLTDELTRRSANGFRQSFTSVELPRYAALNEAASQWKLLFAK